MSFSILHLPPGPLLPVVLIFHYSGCHVDLLVFSQDASSRLPFASVISWPSVGPNGCGCPMFVLGDMLPACSPSSYLVGILLPWPLGWPMVIGLVYLSIYKYLWVFSGGF